MNERRYFAHLAESAISAGRPLAAELQSACTAIRREPRRVTEAIAHANDGDIGLAMERLRLDPLVAAVAHLRPEATGETSSRLRDLPSSWEVATPVLFPAAYLLALVVLQLSVALYLVVGVLPRLPDPSPRIVVAGVAAALGLSLLAGSAGFLLIQIRTAATGGLEAYLLRHTRAARLCTAASVVIRHGTPAPEAIARLAGAARMAEVDAAALLGEGALDAASLDTLAAWLAGEGKRRARRTSARLKMWGAGALVLSGLLMVGSLYRAIGALAGSMWGELPW
jgi:hypothetical protein